MDKPRVSDLRIGDTGPGGNKVAAIYGKTEDFIVFQNERGETEVWHDADQPTANQGRAQRMHAQLHGAIQGLYGEEERKRMVAELAMAVFNAHISDTKADQD